LHLKGIPYRTVWIEYPDIKELCIKIGAEPTGTRDGAPLYTLPVIQDPSTNEVVSESMDIARYLDKTYPAAPALMNRDSQIMNHTFQVTLMDRIGSVYQIMLPRVITILNPVSQEFFRRTRENSYGKKLEEFSPPGSVRMLHWQELEAGFGTIDAWFKKFGDPPYIMGNSLSYADIYLGSILKWMKMILGGDSEEWQNVKRWHAGRWGRLLVSLDDLNSTEEKL
jgi:glutathione S-transferase